MVGTLTQGSPTLSGYLGLCYATPLGLKGDYGDTDPWGARLCEASLGFVMQFRWTCENNLWHGRPAPVGYFAVVVHPSAFELTGVDARATKQIFHTLVGAEEGRLITLIGAGDTGAKSVGNFRFSGNIWDSVASL
jgi:hypothetical protein